MISNNASSPPPSWGKLISQLPDKPNLHFSMKANAPNEFQMDTKWRIYQTQDGTTTKLLNLSASYIKINNHLLEIGQEQTLTSGDTISFSQRECNSFDYVLSLNGEARNGLQRPRPETPKFSPRIKSIKTEIRLDELECSICLKTLYKGQTLNPCLHRFCSGCLSESLQYSTQCPNCREEILSFRKDPFLLFFIPKAIEQFPERQRSDEERKKLDEKDLISRGYTLVRDEVGVYTGFCVNGQKNGEGKMMFKDGLIYQGMWKDDKREGEGSFTCIGGVTYKAKWSNNLMIQSQVKIIFGNGDIYEGETKDFLCHGKGTLKYSNGDVFEGDFKKEKIEGYGTYFYHGGSKYTGNWINGNRDGQGQMNYTSGDIYQGNWKNNQRNGAGIYKYANGLQYKGTWEQDKSVGEGLFVPEDGRVFKGEWQD